MNLSLKPHPLIAHWFPGMVLLMLLALSYSGWRYQALKAAFAPNASDATVTILLLSLGAFFIGEVVDSMRDWLVERFFERRANDAVNWLFFFTCPADKLEQFSDYFYTYYVLNINLALALAFFVLTLVFSVILLPQCAHNLRGWAVGFGGFICMVILFMDAFTLRQDIVRITNNNIQR